MTKSELSFAKIALAATGAWSGEQHRRRLGGSEGAAPGAQETGCEDGCGTEQDLKPRQICWQGFLSR